MKRGLKKREKEIFWKKLNGRAGMSKLIIKLVKEFMKNPSYKEAIKLAGKLRLLAEIAEVDSYWEEKMLDGYYGMEEKLRWNTKF